MSEQILFLSRLEFAVLLLAKNIKEIMCFPLPKQQDINEKQMIEAIYELVCMECLQVKETSVELTDFMEEMIGEMEDATQYFLIESGNPLYPQKIVYIGKKLIILENVQEAEKTFRLFSIERQEFWKWLEDSMEIPKAIIEKKTEAKQMIEDCELAFQEKQALEEHGKKKAFQSLSDWIKQIEAILDETVYFGIRWIKEEKQEKSRNLLLCQGAINLWFLWQKEIEDLFQKESEEEKLYIEPDSAEFRQEIAQMLWREEI